MRQNVTPLAINQAMTASFNSAPQNLISIYGYSIQIRWTGGTGTTGSFKLQASNDAGDTGSGQAVSAPTNWSDLTTPAATAVSTGSGSVMIDVPACGYRWVRVVYTFTAGTGTANIVINTKGV